jgi:hypothetical protein
MPWLPSPALVVVLTYIKKDMKFESFKSVVPESWQLSWGWGYLLLQGGWEKGGNQSDGF